MGFFVKGLIEELMGAIVDAQDDDQVTKNDVEKILDTIAMLIEIDDPVKYGELINSHHYREGRKEVLNYFN